MENYDLIVERINNLIDKVDRGFEGVHSRQDKANGKLMRHDEEISDHKVELAKINTKILIGTPIIASIVSIALNVLFAK